jgi:hypothetical protein
MRASASTPVRRVGAVEARLTTNAKRRCHLHVCGRRCRVDGGAQSRRQRLPLCVGLLLKSKKDLQGFRCVEYREPRAPRLPICSLARRAVLLLVRDRLGYCLSARRKHVGVRAVASSASLCDRGAHGAVCRSSSRDGGLPLLAQRPARPGASLSSGAA